MGKKKLIKANVIKSLKNELSVEESVMEFGLENKNHWHEEMKRFKIDVVYDEEQLVREIYEVSRRMSKSEFIKLLGIHANSINRLPFGMVIKVGTLIRLCKIFDVNFLITCSEGNEGRIYKLPKYTLTVPIDLQRWLKRNESNDAYEGDMTDRYRISENIDMLMKILDALGALLKKKQISDDLVKEILNKFDRIIKEAVIIGIKSQKSGKGDELELKILQEILNEK